MDKSERKFWISMVLGVAALGGFLIAESVEAKSCKDSVYLETYTETFVFDNCSKTGANDIVLASYCEDRGEDANTIFSGPLNSPPISIIIVMPEDQFVFYNNDCYIVSNEPKKGGGVNYFVACDAP